MPSEAIHGNKSQNARQRALENFSRGRARVLVATDLASRGIDVAGITHVINYELPADAESYVHRIGRTARAGASGIAVSFCDGSERGQLKSIERLTNQRLTVVPMPANEDMPAAPPERPRSERNEREERGERPRQKRGHRGGPSRPAFGDRSHGGERASTASEHRWSNGDHRDASKSERPRNDRVVRGDRPRQGDDRPRSHGGQHRGDQPARHHAGHQADGPRAARSHDDRPHGDRTRNDRPHGDRPQAPRPAWKGRRFGGGRGRAA